MTQYTPETMLRKIVYDFMNKIGAFQDGFITTDALQKPELADEIKEIGKTYIYVWTLQYTEYIKNMTKNDKINDVN